MPAHKRFFRVISFCIPLFFVFLTNSSAIDYKGELSYTEQNAKNLYSKRSVVLQNLDIGMLSYYSGDYAKSIHKLTTAEQKIDEYFAKSVSQAIASWIVNDKVIDYEGEDYEDIYLNLFKSLSYYHLGMLEDAIVEINRFENKSQTISSRYQEQLIKARNAAENADKTPVSVTFHNSALGQYLALLYHRGDGDYNSAESDSRFIHDAFVTQSLLYNFPEPKKLIKDELSVPKSKGRINLLAFSNGCPIKTEMVYPAILYPVFVAVPFMQKQTAKVGYVNVSAVNTQTGEAYADSLQQIESLDNIAQDTFQTHAASIYSKAIARMIVKRVNSDLQDGIGSEMAKSDNNVVSLIGNILQILSVASDIEAWVTESADTRISKYFPARADVGGLTVEPGTYNITMEFYRSKGGKLVYRKTFKNIEVVPGKLCLLDAAYLGNNVVAGAR